MKKGGAPAAPAQAEVKQAEVLVPEPPQYGCGKFEFKDQTIYEGNWKLASGIKAKHGYGKMVFSGATGGKGQEQYEGDWIDDKQDGYGRYTFTSGAVYSGEWKAGKMHGKGKIVNADGTSYEGDWENSLMHGEGLYIDSEDMRWAGIFINGSYESKIQKKLRADKEIGDKLKDYQTKALGFFIQFAEQFAKSTKQSMKENMGIMFATADKCIDFVAEPYTKLEERTPDKWAELIKAIYNEGKVQIRALQSKEHAAILKQESILVEQIRSKKGGQIAEIEATVGEKRYHLVLCELTNEKWALVHFGEPK